MMRLSWPCLFISTLFVGILQCYAVADVFHFVQVTDPHLDLEYDPKGDVQTNCHAPSPSLSSSTLTDASHPYGQYGCDSPELLLNVTFTAITKFPSSPIDVVLFTGDFGPHVFETEQDIFGSVVRGTDLLQAFFPGKLVLPLIGNDDTYPHHTLYCGPTAELTALWELWQTWLPNKCKDSFISGGYYALNATDLDSQYRDHFPPSLRVIALNTFLLQYEHDPESQEDCGMFDFLQENLEESVVSGENVLILMHTPPGGSRGFHPLWHRRFIKRYVEIMEAYGGLDIIIAQLAAHTHRDVFHLVADDQTTMNSDKIEKKSDWAPAAPPVLIPGALTVTAGNNPSFRVYDISVDNESNKMTLADYENFYFDLAAADASDPEIDDAMKFWHSEYRFSNTYSQAAIDMKTTLDIYNKFESDKDFYEDTFAKYFRAESESDISKIKSRCCNLCGMRYIEKDMLEKCTKDCGSC